MNVSKWTCQAVLRFFFLFLSCLEGSLPPYALRSVPNKMLLESIKGDAVAMEFAFHKRRYFQSLLLDRNSQLWRVIREYVQHEEDLVSLFTFCGLVLNAMFFYLSILGSSNRHRRANPLPFGDWIIWRLQAIQHGFQTASVDSKQPAHCRGRARNARGVAAPKGTVIDPKTNRKLYDRSTRLATVLWAILSEASAWFVMVKTNYTA
ncbi:uncharacterized protein LOC112351636 [Selaginella moellendorffii]|uniref:uncharacterized protein LOC112351636 n=1 Tax=Selaginella moellendorffii TaxID=88036 RepID=UPI000D1C5D53|nr:uncharacterized protein LOC112351636 [Selaginella moellendorffii]|eukprot:XP_024545638.1 uncharacterized protein LOC112351636 [Selaginella moellendorffii]